MPGFGVRVGARSKSFVIMYGINRHLKTIGHFPEMTLRDARTEARRLFAKATPINRVTALRELVSAYLEECQERLRPSTVERYNDVLKNAPDIKLDQINRNIAKTPHQIKAYKALFNWAIREELVDRNPFMHMKVTHGKRDRVLTDEEIAKLWSYDHEPFSTILKLLILTGQRRSMIWKLQPEWITPKNIKFPAEIMKQGKPHTLPYGQFTSFYLKKAPFSFNGWSKAKVRCDQHAGVTDWVIHDIRRHYATRMIEFGIPVHVVEALLAHSSGQISGVLAIYVHANLQREMRDAVLRYEKHILNLIQPEG